MAATLSVSTVPMSLLSELVPVLILCRNISSNRGTPNSFSLRGSTVGLPHRPLYISGLTINDILTSGHKSKQNSHGTLPRIPIPTSFTRLQSHGYRPVYQYIPGVLTLHGSPTSRIQATDCSLHRASIRPTSPPSQDCTMSSLQTAASGILEIPRSKDD